MSTIKAVGIDAAFANMGFARVEVTYMGPGVVKIECSNLILVSTEVTEDRKVVRKSSTELRRAQELVTSIREHTLGCQYAFVEVPSGSQSASAARALGIAVGVLASCTIPIIEVSAQDVKEAVLGRRGKGKMPSKLEIIEWAASAWPNAPWARHEHDSRGRIATKGANKGRTVGAFRKGDLQARNEHLADALASVAAGVSTPEFRRLLALIDMHTPATPLRKRIPLL